ncbi:MAG: pyridoxal-phosphate dependent enzyme [Eudoraea sp.]|nr:pyridoxal-phosphate dependent enzyme [Eudoraea sp.]
MDKQKLIDTHRRITPFIHRTPVMTSRLIDQKAGAALFFKCENFQGMGAYKLRGATNAILQLSESQRKKGVVTHSSGNFAQALSLAAQRLGVDAHIVMPSSAPKVKMEGVKAYGGNIYICAPTLEAREAEADRIAEETGATFMHPSNDMEVILGQGTAAMELLEDHPDLDVIVTPVGGGGLIAGSALAAHYFGNNCQVIGAEPFEVDDAYRSFHSGKIETNETTNTIADGLKTVLGDQTFPIIRQYVHDIIRVTEEEIVSAMKLIWERMKIIVEPSSAVALAAVLREPEYFQGKKVGIVISGGNVDLGNLPF